MGFSWILIFSLQFDFYFYLMQLPSASEACGSVWGHSAQLSNSSAPLLSALLIPDPLPLIPSLIAASSEQMEGDMQRYQWAKSSRISPLRIRLGKWT